MTTQEEEGGGKDPPTPQTYTSVEAEKGDIESHSSPAPPESCDAEEDDAKTKHDQKVVGFAEAEDTQIPLLDKKYDDHVFMGGKSEEGLHKRGSSRLQKEGSLILTKNGILKLSKRSMEYDFDGDGVLDENEQALRDMDDGDGIDLIKVYERMNELSRFKEKYANTKSMMTILGAFGAFILCANLAMSIVAVSLYKDTKVVNNIMTTNDRDAHALATTGYGSTAKATWVDFSDPSAAGGNYASRNVDSGTSASIQCDMDDFGDIESHQDLYKGSLTSETCEALYSDALNGARPITVDVTNGNTDTSMDLDSFSVHRTVIEQCTYSAFVGESETWYFRDCDSDCMFFVANNDEIPIPDCLVQSPQSSFLEEGDIGTLCTSDHNCKSKKCVAIEYEDNDTDYEGIGSGFLKIITSIRGGAERRCVGFVEFENPATLEQSVFNQEGRLEEMSPALYKQFQRTFQLIHAVQATSPEHNSVAEDFYPIARAQQVEANDPPYETKFVKETGCLHVHRYFLNKPGWANRCVHARELTPDYPQLYREAKELDMGVVEKYGDICYGIFRGTVGNYVIGVDWFQVNFNQGVATLETDRGTCYVQEGFTRAFWEASGLWTVNPDDEGMEHHLRECANECIDTTGKTCTVVLGGHSQGGGLAVQAAARLQDLDPVVITTAGASGIYPGPDGVMCPALNKDRIFRFVAAQGVGQNLQPNNLLYDPVPLLTMGKMPQLGHEFRPSNEGASSVSYFYPFPPAVYGGLRDRDYGFVNYIHTFKTYYRLELFDKMAEHVETTGNPIQLGYANDMLCGHNRDCHSNRCARSTWNPFSRRTCQPPASVNRECFVDSDCTTGRCDARFCYEKKANGGACNEPSDCISNRCDRRVWFNPNSKICFEALTNGERCNESYDCESGRCDASSAVNRFNKICMARLNNGERCNEHTDCVSLSCKGRFGLNRKCKD